MGGQLARSGEEMLVTMLVITPKHSGLGGVVLRGGGKRGGKVHTL